MDDSDNEDIGRDFSKILRIAEINGYREGIMDETEILLQKRFDSGYELGVKLGLVAGFYNGLSKSIIQDKSSFLSQDSIETAKSIIPSTEFKNVLENHCKMCINNEFYTKPFDEIHKEQKTAIDGFVMDINEKSSSIISELKVDESLMNKLSEKSSEQTTNPM